jgi:hypothetical protein
MRIVLDTNVLTTSFWPVPWPRALASLSAAIDICWPSPARPASTCSARKPSSTSFCRRLPTTASQPPNLTLAQPGDANHANSELRTGNSSIMNPNRSPPARRGNPLWLPSSQHGCPISLGQARGLPLHRSIPIFDGHSHAADTNPPEEIPDTFRLS